jgi:hypothetical protein
MVGCRDFLTMLGTFLAWTISAEEEEQDRPRDEGNSGENSNHDPGNCSATQSGILLPLASRQDNLVISEMQEGVLRTSDDRAWRSFFSVCEEVVMQL